MKISLASVPFTTDMSYMLECIRASIVKASQQHSRIICFPEACIPGMRGIGIDIPDVDADTLDKHLRAVCEMTKENAINVILQLNTILTAKE